MKQKITLFGGSGTMGFETFKVLWDRRDRHDLTLLLRRSDKNRKLFAPWMRRTGEGLTILWGDATRYEDVKAAVAGTDCVLDAMACISPRADYYPETAKAVNTDGIAHIIRAIGEEPDGARRIRLVYTGTVAETGDRLPPVHWGRVGDPLKPSLFDYYAVTKIAGERIVLESELTHWVSLRMTFIMPVKFREYRALTEPIMFHMPIRSCMENISSRDAGLGLANAAEVPGNSDFWRRAYNMGGGPSMRTTAYEYQDRSIRLFGGTGLQAVADRNWFATGNFHMQYYADSGELNEYLHFWRDSLDDWEALLVKDLPAGLKLVRKLAGRFPGLRERIDRATREQFAAMAAQHRNGTIWWRRTENRKRLDAFFGGIEAYDRLPGWDAPLPELRRESEPAGLLDHGYDESASFLVLEDLEKAAVFRGGACLSSSWSGDLFETLEWKCAFGHRFSAKPNTVLKAGHWCPECEAPSWDFKKIAAKNPFFAQVIDPFRDSLPDEPVTAEDLQDIAGADRD